LEIQSGPERLGEWISGFSWHPESLLGIRDPLIVLCFSAGSRFVVSTQEGSRMVQLKYFVGLALASALVLVGNTSAQAWNYHSHGSYGSCGSSGGSYGSWGSHGSSGGFASHGSSGGFFSHGSHGSSGGFFSHGSNGSSGSSGSYGSYGSSGSSGGSVGTASADASTSTAVAQTAPEIVDRAQLVLNVPADAIVYLSNQRMTLEGTVREFTIPGLTSGTEYAYPVRVDLVQDGKTLTASANQQVQAGQKLNLVFNQTSGQSEIVALRN
jgi:uncharacterized protein (TIGR03000 family)